MSDGASEAATGTAAPPSGAHMTSAQFFARAAERLTLDVPPGLREGDALPRRGDHDVDPTLTAIAAVRPIRPAAVLVPVVDRPEPTILLTQRAAHLKDHAGQISFPGGKIDQSDASPLATALREADEEIGLAGDAIKPIGYLDLYLTAFGFRIVPAVARVAPDFALTLNENEVDDAFEVPLAFLMTPENHQRHSREWQGMTRYYYAMPFGERYIWGVTAGILRNMYELLFEG